MGILKVTSRSFFSSLAIGVLLFWGCMDAQVYADSDSSAHALLEQAAQNSLKLQSLSSFFVQEKEMFVLKRPLRSEGFFCLDRRDKQVVLWSYTKPLPMGFSFLDGKATLYDPNQSRSANSAENALVTTIVSHILDWIDAQPARIEKQYAVTRPNPREPMLRLTPKRKTFFVQLDVLFTPDLTSVQKLTFLEKNGDSIRIVFDRTQINSPFPEQCRHRLSKENP